MNQKTMFKCASWVQAGEYSNAFMGKEEDTPYFPILRAHFNAKNVKKATIKIVGLGFFTAYINGKRLSDDLFLPPFTDYEKRENHPIGEQLFNHRLYVPEFDITEFLVDGYNTLAVFFGGGPGAWGCAIVEVPYRFYKEYGDISFCEKMYPQMLRYFDYMESHSVNNLVVRDKEDEWCLGECLPPESVVIPAPFVNNYYYIRSMERVIEIGKVIGKTSDIEMLKQRIKERKEAIIAAYYGSWNGSFVGGLQGANAFAVDLKLDELLGDDRIYKFMLNRCQKLGRFDTGICGTDLLTRVLFEHGDGETAANLILSTDPVSFYGFMQRGSTTIGESWPNTYWDRSRFHPMFGAIVAYFYSYLLGIRQKEDSCGYKNLIIAPVFVSKINKISGSRFIPDGEVKIEYEKIADDVKAKIILPEFKTAEFVYKGKTTVLYGGENEFYFKL